jgi:hypothetical protein
MTAIGAICIKRVYGYSRDSDMKTPKLPTKSSIEIQKEIEQLQKQQEKIEQKLNTLTNELQFREGVEEGLKLFFIKGWDISHHNGDYHSREGFVLCANETHAKESGGRALGADEIDSVKFVKEWNLKKGKK